MNTPVNNDLSVCKVTMEHPVIQLSAVVWPAAVVEVVYRYTCEDGAHYWQYECDDQDARRCSIGSFLKRTVIIIRIANEHDERKDREDIKRLNQSHDTIR